MIKPLLAFFITLLLFTNAEAQKGGIVYYLTNYGKLVSTKDSADYSMVISPPDSSIDKTMYVVREYDKNGKLRLVTGSKTIDVNLKYLGHYTTYFPDGKTKTIGTYESGDMKGRQITYYPNGNLYYIVNYVRPGVAYFGECRDSTGKVLTRTGNGVWKQFDDEFQYLLAQGKIENGLQEGEWLIRRSPKVSFTLSYKQGREVQFGQAVNDSMFINNTYKPLEIVPSFPGGMEALGDFLSANLRYPTAAREHDIQGSVHLKFIVETDGSLTNIVVSSGIGNGCDEEAIRIMKLSPKWIPGLRGGQPVKLAFTVPVIFTLAN